MTGETLFVFATLAVAIVLFASDRFRLDLVALVALLALLLAGTLTPAEALAGFSDPAVIMIAALFVVGAAMLESGLADRFGRALGRAAGASRARLTAVLMLGTGMLSAFVSTTGTVALMLPVAASLARNAGLSPSLLLMPLAIAALLGGLLTLIATPPNIIVSEQLSAAGHAPFAFFDFTPVGIVMLAVGMAVMVPFGARLLRPAAPADRPAGADEVASVPSVELVRGYEIGQIARMRIPGGSPLVGISPAAAGLRGRFGANVVAIRRPHGRSGRLRRVRRTSEEPLRAGDELDLRAAADAVDQLREEMQLELLGYRSEPDAVLAEVLLTPRSRLIGTTIAEARFRSRYAVNVLSLRRQGQAVEGDLATETLRFADTLLVAGSPQRIDLLRGESGDFVVVARTEKLTKQGPFSRREVFTVATLLGMIALLAFGVVPAVTAVLLAAVCTVAAGTLDMEKAYRSVNWQSVILIAAMLPMATALDKTGGIDVIVALLQPALTAGTMPTLAAVFILTGALGLVISNTATAVLVAPVAIGAASQLGVSPYPLLMTVATAASTSFATPVATPVNLLIIGPGAYRFGDFLRVGLLVQGIIFVVTLLFVPWLFPFG